MGSVTGAADRTQVTLHETRKIDTRNLRVNTPAS